MKKWIKLLCMKRVITLCCIFITGMLVACGKKEVEQSQVWNDIIAYEGFAQLNVKLNSLEIIKRQTNYEQKTDYIYCMVCASNNDYSVVRNYEMKYELYNDGWLLEDIVKYENSNMPDETIPLRGVSYEQIMKDIENMRFLEYASDENVMDFNYVCPEQIQNGFVEIDGDLCRYLVNVDYKYGFWNEKVVLPIVYYFCQQADGSYGWNLQVSFDDIERTAEYNEGVLGEWIYEGGWGGANGKVEVLSFDGDSFYAKYYLYDGWKTIIDGAGEIRMERSHVYGDDRIGSTFHLGGQFAYFVNTGAAKPNMLRVASGSGQLEFIRQ